MEAMELFWYTASQIHDLGGKVVGRDILKALRLFTPEMKIRNRGAWRGPLGKVQCKLNNPFRVRITEWSEQDRIDYREDCGIRTDTQGKSQNSRDGETS